MAKPKSPKTKPITGEIAEDTATLEVVDHDYCFWIVWMFQDDEGATVGEEIYTADQLATCKPEDREVLLAALTAAKTKGVAHHSKGYYWESAKDANAALRAIKAAIKNDTGAPWPDWTVPALAAGWKPPKGWKPS